MNRWLPTASFFAMNARRKLLAVGQKTAVIIVLSTLLFGEAVPEALQPLFPLGTAVPTAQALAGDFSIYRSASTAAVPTGGSEVEIVWDTPVSETSGIDLQSGSTTIDLSEGGKYLVLYNAWTEETGTANGENRRSFKSYLTLDEGSGDTELAYGGGSGYIRDNNGDDNNAYANGAAIIDAAAGADLKINIQRDDANSDNQTRLRAGTNGVSVLKMKDDFDYARIPITSNSGDISSSTFQKVTWSNADELDTGSFGYTNGTTDITFKGNAGDVFMVTYNLRLEMTDQQNVRSNYEARLMRDGVEVPGTRVTTYLRGGNNGNNIFNGTLAYAGLVEKATSSDETFTVEVRRESAVSGTPPAVSILANESGFSAAALPSNAHFVSLTSATTQSVPSTQSPIDFDEQIIVESDAFSHSTSTNASRVNIDLAGDYLFFSTVYADRSNTGNGDRDPYRVEWRLDGSATQAYGGHGSFLRGNQGNDSTYTAGSSGGIILPSLTDTQYVEVTMYDEEDTADANLDPARVAIQGVEMSLLFQTNVDVSATGSHVSSSVIPATNLYQGGTYVIEENTGTRNVTNITLTESGTVDGSTGLDNLKLYYDEDTSSPYDCASESYDPGSDAQFGVTDDTGFSGANGTASFSDNVEITTTKSLCVYVVYDVTSSANDGETVNITIDDPSTDVVVSNSGSVSPSTATGPSGQTTLANAELTQIHYHWREDDGTEAGASSVDGTEDTVAGGFQPGTQRRLRIAVSAEGSAAADPAQFRLQYAEKAGTCSAATGWADVAAAGGAWDAGDSPNLVFAQDATNIASPSLGAVSDEESSFYGTSTLADTGDKTVSLQIDSDEFVELEYTVIVTAAATEGTTYCFRVVDETPDVTHDFRLPLTIQSSQVASTVTDFPVYVDLSTLGSHFFANVNSDGGDIRVTTADGTTEVAREVVSISTASSTGELHFLAPTVSSSTNTTFYIYYGASGESDYQASSTYGTHSVWEPYYSAVYHLPESGTTYADSTGNGYDGIGEAVDPSVTTGKLGSGQDFGADGRIDLGLGPSVDLNAAGEYYVSVWLNLDTSTGDQSPVSQYEGPGDFLLWADEAGLGTGFCHYNGAYMPNDCQDLNNQSVGSWQYVAAYHDGTNGGIYLDGVETGAGPTATTFGVDTAMRFAIGATDGDDTDRYFDGQIDEVRIAEVSLGEDWSAAEFSNQDTPTTFYATSSFESVNETAVPVTYDVYPEANITADILVYASSTQAVSLDVNTTEQYLGGTFIIERAGGNRTLTDITLTETGTVNASSSLDNIEIYYDLAADCSAEVYNAGSDAQFGGTDTDGFSGPNGTSTFTSAGVTLNTTQTFCGYVVLDVTNNAANGETINVEISDPSVDVVVTASTVGPSSPISPTGSTTINGPVLTQTGYHWRNDDGTEASAMSATGNIQDTPIENVPRNTTYRLRYQINNAGAVASQATQYQLEYGTKEASCSAVSTWLAVDVGDAVAMATTSQLIDGNNTSDIATTTGGIANPGGQTFLATNGGQRDLTDTTGSVTLTETQFTEFEYAVYMTDLSGYETTYCFRLTDNGTPLPAYTEYAELTTREQQDFFIQRGTLYVSGTSTTLQAGVDYQAPTATSAAFVRLTGSHHTGSGDSVQGTQDASNVTAYISDQSDITSSFTISRPSIAINSTRIDWEIIEYVGLPGADNEMIVRGVGSVTYGATALAATSTATDEVSDHDDVVVFITGLAHPAANNTQYLGNQSTSRWASSSEQAVFDRETSNGGASHVSYAVVEYTGLNWRIQRIEHNYTNNATTEQESITAVNSLSRTFLHTQKRVGDVADNGLNDYGHQVWLSSLGAISFLVDTTNGGGGAGDPTEHYSVAWVIENTQLGSGAMVVTQQSGSVDADETVEPRTTSVLIGSPLGNVSNTSLFINNESTGDGTAFPRAMLGATIASSTHFELFESDAGQTQDYWVELVEWPVAELAWEQNYYRFYVDNDAVTPSDPWPAGAPNLGENESITSADEPLGESERVRIRMTLQVNNASWPALTETFKLQYGRRETSCSAISTWTDVGAAGSGEIWRGYDGTPADGSTIASTSLLISLADVGASYEEENSSVANPAFADIDSDVEFDWVVEQNGAVQRSNYCFRMVKSDGTALASYNNYPTVRTSGYTPIISRWRWYDDETNETPSSPLAAENVTPIDIANGEIVKLRTTLQEVEGAAGSNLKFSLQYSQFPDFTDGGTTLTATSTCTATSTWCYADGAGVDNAAIAGTVLSDPDLCVAGVGPGCGTYNETATTSSSLAHGSLETIEMEFTLQSAGPRVNGVYYFRLVDTTTEDPLFASTTFPSVQTESSSFTSTSTGVVPGTVIDGFTIDATSTPNSVTFATPPLNTQYTAAQRFDFSTNATEGYQVLVFADSDMTSTVGATIPPVTGTNAAPTSWSGGCPGGQTGCFGYHSGDDTLAGGSVRFAAQDTFAALTTTPEELFFSSIPGSETHDVVYSIQIGDLQPAGDYETNITYVVVPVF